MLLQHAFVALQVIAVGVVGFAVGPPAASRQPVRAATTAVTMAADGAAATVDRRAALSQAAAATTGLAVWWTTGGLPASAATTKKVLVAGATGQTGRRVVDRLSKLEGVAVTGGVRNVDKATKALAESSIAVRGAMVQQVDAVGPVDLVRLDVVEDSVDALAATLDGFDALVVATGFVPGNPLKMDAAAHAVDNLGTIKLVDAAVRAKVSDVVMVSSILTNGRAWGQENSPGFQITNAFGHVLDEKIQAEKYLRGSSLAYTIVRPGGLKAKPPSGGLRVSKEDTLNAGEISRDYVADVVVAALFDPAAKNKVVEIVEDDGLPASPLAPSPAAPPKVPFV